MIHDTSASSWGLSIIALTVAIRALLLPLTLKQFKSMRGLQKIAPEMKKLQESTRTTSSACNQEMMKFYQENKVNPFASCLPLLRSCRSSSRSSTCCRTTCAGDLRPERRSPCGESPGRRASSSSPTSPTTRPAAC